MDKNHPDKTFQTKDPRTKAPREQLRENLYRGLLSGFFELAVLKMGDLRCVKYFWEVPECVAKCYMGRGSKLAKNSVTYFMDGPRFYLSMILFIFLEIT